jgi:osmotically inducible protein OsmC
MQTRKAKAIWSGNLKNGTGKINLDSIGCEGHYSFTSRFENGSGTNPEELIAAAHAGCFSMALANLIAEKGFNPDTIVTTAHVSLSKDDKGPYISKIELQTEATIPDIDHETLQVLADEAKRNCPVSKALASVDIFLQISLK